VLPSIRSRGDGLRLLRHGHELEYVAVWVFEIDAAAAVPVIELTVIEAPGGAAVCEPRPLDALEDGVELGIADVEGVMVTAERGVVIEQERQAAVHPNRREVAACRIERQAEDVGEEPGSGHFVTRRHDGVVQDDGHGTALLRAR
jgi:hypothetical protein